MKTKSKNKHLILKILSILLILFIIVLTIYFNTYYHSDKNLLNDIKSNNDISIIETNKYIFFDSPSTDTALIFYPGAKVESESYSNLMYNLSKNNIDIYLLKVPGKIAFFATNYPDKIISNNNYNKVYLGGHSLGGVVAANYLNKTKNKIDGIIFLASYSTNKISEEVNIISIYGSNDNVLNLTKYNEAKKNFNTNYHELVIEGGNHSGFANYGNQKGDGENTISNSIQQQETINYIINNFN